MALELSRIILVLSVVLFQAKARMNITQFAAAADDDNFLIRNGCASLALTGGSDNLLRFIHKIRIPTLSWIQTPSIVEVEPGHYQALGRVIHLKHLKELLQTQKKLKLDATRKTKQLVPRLDILADTLYIEGTVYIYGINHIKIYAREITAKYDSNVFFSAPNWDQQFKSRVVAGKDGEDGENGINGPRVEMFFDVIRGLFEVSANGGDGHRGQDGGDGTAGRDSGRSKPDVSSSVCDVGPSRCPRYISGARGDKGSSGGDGGDAGKPGNGGNAGFIGVRVRKITGQMGLRACRGTGADPAKNGKGGRGGAGGLGGRGRKCELVSMGFPIGSMCTDDGAWSRAPQGPRGSDGKAGSTPEVTGKNGSVKWTNVLREWKLDKASKRGYPLELINIIRRKAEDLVLSNNANKKGRAALKFVLKLVNERSDMEEMKKEVKRKLGFLGKEGYDIFGKNKLFAPRIKWQALEDTVEDIKKAAESYENAFNDIISTIKEDQNFHQIASKMSAVTSLQVKAEKKRLEEARLIAESEKRAYVKSIQHFEEQMSSILENINTMLPDVHKKAKFNKEDFLAVLQGTVGFAKAIASKSPLDAIDAGLGLMGSLSGKQCLKSLESIRGSIKKWLTFGEHYKPLADSSDLDFDQLDVSSVPHIMQANLEMNKEKFTEELVCLLDVASLQTDVAEFKQHVESFFIAGAARIELIAEIMDLDNDIGGYNFDIPLLSQTETAIKDVTKTKGAPITKKLQQTFMENLLGTYRELERSFFRNIYELHKAFAFRTLWQGYNPLASFQRVASESVRGTGRLNGVVQLTGVLRRTQELKDKANKCFTYNTYTTDISKWSFDNVKNKKMFQELASKGQTRFNLNIKNSRCKTCYNVRLLKIYIELLGKEKQPDSVPQKIYLQVRHLSGSYFRAGDDTIKQFHQPVGSFKNIKFDRFTLSNVNKCKGRKSKGKNPKTFCVTEDDSRWVPMCNHVLNKRGSHGKDSLLGMEECKSPFGIYELKIPLDKKLACDDDGIKDTNCKDLDLTKFTQMNVWTHYYYWSKQYPKGPDDIICSKSQQKKRNETIVIDQDLHTATGGEDQL